jgi:starch synthase (maltosyl-transferring)
MVGRIVIEAVRPVVDCGQWPARAVAGQRITVQATIFRDGHDILGAGVRVRGPGGVTVFEPMRHGAPGTDRWSAEVTVPAEGLWDYVVEAWDDPVATWRRNTSKKLEAGQDITLELEEGALLMEAAARGVPAASKQVLLDAAAAIRADGPQAHRYAAGLRPEVTDLVTRHPVRYLLTRSPRQRVLVDRPVALFGSWYEFFPRSEGATATSSGTFDKAAERLPAIADMGFDVVYLPPIHPIGRSYRKGPNNTLTPGPDDPGSPWAIGNEDGGHTAVHPDLGTIEDFDRFVAKTRELGMEVALDYALQCSPDHPWVKEHPEWFNSRPDGSIAYAENPPKKYQDIYPLNFDNPNAKGLYEACKEILDHWISHGVKIFRVDNPHTKPVRFWEWLIAAVKAEHPDVLFLAEAFTRPPMMRMLAKVGFTQSYTYYTWRNGKDELQQYIDELAHSEVADYMRPNFFVNTPDILHEYLQHGGPPAFKIRAVLAATLSPTWGVYSGYELCEGTAVRPGSEEYLDSEKYQYRPRDWSNPPLAGYLTKLNQVRHNHPALHWLSNVHFHLVDSDQIIAFSKQEGDDVVLVIVNLDPHNVREATAHLWMPALGLGWNDGFEVHDELTGGTWWWQGASNYVRLDPAYEPAHVFHIRRR